MRRFPRVALALVAAGPLAWSQSFNVDIGANQVYGTPGPAYGGGIGQPGLWNVWSGNAPIPLSSIDNQTTGVTAQYLWNLSWGEVESDIPGSSGGDERLMDDRRQSATTFGAIEDVQVSGLWNGDYEVATYAFAASFGNQTFVSVLGSPDPPVTLGFGTFPGVHVQNVTFSLHHVAVANGVLTIEVDTANSFFSTLSGFQVRWVPEAPSSYCTAKLNSQGCLPLLAASGSASVSAGGGFLLTCSNVLNNKPGILLYSTAGSAATPFHGGWLCLAPPIRRTPGVGSGGSVPPAVDCSGVWQLDFNAFVSGSLGGSPAPELSQPGTTVDVQWWGRDPGFPPPSNVALSAGLQFVQGY